MSGSQSGFTYGQLVQQARTLLQDQFAPYRYQDSELYFAVTEGLAIARVIRPDLFLAGGLDAAPLFITSANSLNNFPIAWQYAPAFINFMIGRAEQRDDTYADDNRAAQMLGLFKEQLTGIQMPMGPPPR